MAVITKSSESDHGLTIFTVEGAPTVEEILAQVAEFMKAGPTPLVLWDYTRGSLNLPVAELRSLLERGRKYINQRAGGKGALVFSTDVDYGAGRMLEVFADMMEIPLSVRVFRDVQEARQWLGVS